MPKSPDAFRTISEVAEWLDIQAHVLRFWESKFTQVKPIKRAGGRRYYRPDDMLLLGGIKKLLHDDGLTIKGVQKILREEGMNHVAALSAPLDDLMPSDLSVDHPDTIDMPASLTDAPVAAEPQNVVLPFEPARAASVVKPDPENEGVQKPAPTTADDTEPDVPDEDQATAPAAVAENVSPEPDETPRDAAAVTPEPQAPVTIDEDDATPVPVAASDEQQAQTPQDATRQDNASEPDPLPTFLRRPLTDPADATPTDDTPTDDKPADKTRADDTPDAPEVAEAPAAKPRLVDLPPLPAEDQIPASPGLLTKALQGKRFSKETAQDVAPLLARLQALSDSLGQSAHPARQD